MYESAPLRHKTTVVAAQGLGMGEVEEATILGSGFGARGSALKEGSSHGKLEEMSQWSRGGRDQEYAILPGQEVCPIRLPSTLEDWFWGHRK